MEAALVSAFLVIPAATARLPARRFSTMAWLSVEIGVATAFAGLLASYWLNIPSGACIVLTQGFLFLICLLASKFLFPAKARP